MSTATKHRNETMAEALKAAGVKEARTPYGTVRPMNGDGVLIEATRAQVRTWAAMAGATVEDEGMRARLPDEGGITDMSPPGRTTEQWAHDVMVDAVVHRGNGWLVGYIAARSREQAAARPSPRSESLTIREAVLRILHRTGDPMSVNDVVEAAEAEGQELKAGSVYDALNRAVEDGEVSRRKDGRRVKYRTK